MNELLQGLHQAAVYSCSLRFGREINSSMDTLISFLFWRTIDNLSPSCPHLHGYFVSKDNGPKQTFVCPFIQY